MAMLGLPVAFAVLCAIALSIAICVAIETQTAWEPNKLWYILGYLILVLFFSDFYGNPL